MSVTVTDSNALTVFKVGVEGHSPVTAISGQSVPIADVD
jgi:hypothetical protein